MISDPGYCVLINITWDINSLSILRPPDFFVLSPPFLLRYSHTIIVCGALRGGFKMFGQRIQI